MAETQRQQILDLLHGSELFRDIFDSIHDGILVVDRNKRVIYANPTAKKLLGLSRKKLIGVKAEDIPISMHDSGGEELMRTSRPFAIAFSEYHVGEAQPVILKRLDGSTLPVLFNIQRKDQDLTVAILTDSSNLVRHQMQTEEYYQMLAHDFRSPLSVILGHAELLQKGEKTPEGIDRSLSAIREAGAHLQKITEEMSDRLELESGNFKLKKEPVRLDEPVRELVSLLSSRETSHHFDLQVPALPPIEMDLYRLKRVLINLITNAMKYSPEGSTIGITAWENSIGVIVTVSNEGPGIETEDLQYIFDPFYISSIGKEKGGIGMGLYIARLIMEAHDGKIYVSSTEKGTIFAIFLPKT